MINSFKPVLTKYDFVRRYETGEFGNHASTWHCPHCFNINYRGLVHLRNRTAGGITYYNLHPYKALILWMQQNNPFNWFISAMAPTEQTLLQGEVCETPYGGLELLYTTVAKPMREALAEQQKTVRGLTAKVILETYLCPNSLEWLYELFRRYPLHVVEFSTYGCNWGTLPNFNTVFWEIRLY
jgi:hypothetical protein